MTYKEAIDWLYSTQEFGIKLGLDGPKNLIKKFLAFPDLGVKVIHVAGTNGKGSTCAMMEALIRGAGHRTALFTSPHLVDFRERIKVNSLMISEQECTTYLTKLKQLCESLPEHPTFFEISLVLALRYFRDKGAEYIILETGMGGRLDATTAIPADLCVITPIAMDHSKWLGDNIEKIALEKAGIMLEGVPVIVSQQEEKAMTVLQEEANHKRCPLTTINTPLLGYSIGIPGEHQKYNANVAVHAVHEIGIDLNYDIVKECLKYVYWPGRFEIIEQNNHTFILDGAHNQQAASALVKTWNNEFPDTKASIILGALEDKDTSAILEQLNKIANNFIFISVKSTRSLSPNELVKQCNEASCTEICESLTDAIEVAQAQKKPILITGSLFLIGEAKSHLESTV